MAGEAALVFHGQRFVLARALYEVRSFIEEPARFASYDTVS